MFKSIALFVCVQALLVQAISANCGCNSGAGINYNNQQQIGLSLGGYGNGAVLGGIGNSIAGLGNYGNGIISQGSSGYGSGYGGIAQADLGITGEVPVSGSTMINGVVPTIGAVQFVGDLAANGFVTITGSTCGCNGYY